jgi:amino acid adenylation domain-containing protein
MIDTTQRTDAPGLAAAASDLLPLDAAQIADRDYWRERLPWLRRAGRLTRQDGSASGNRVTEAIPFLIEHSLRDRLDRITSCDPFLLYTALVGAIDVCLQRYTASTVIVTGSPALAEPDAAPTRTVVPIVESIDPALSFQAFVQRLRGTLADAYARQHFPFRRLLAELDLETDRDAAAMFEVLVALSGLHEAAPPGAFALSFTFERGADAIRGTLAFDPRAFDRGAASWFVTHLLSVLEDGLKRPDAALATLVLTADEDLRQIAQAWNATETNAPAVSVTAQIANRAAEAPDAIAVVCGDAAISYGVLNARANQLASALRARGVRPELPVGVCLDRSLDLVIALLGVWKAGGAYVPLDPAAPPARLAAIVDTAHVPVIVSQERFDDRLPAGWVQILWLHAIADELRQEADGDVPFDEDAASLAYVIHTSGSTGTPKGVAVAQAGVRNLVAAQVPAFGLAPGARVLQFASIGFDASVSEIFTTLASGGVLELLPRDDWRAGDALEAVLRQRAITTVTLPPSVLRGLAPERLPALQTVISAGEACSSELAAEWRDRVRFINAYGPTETAVCATLCLSVSSGPVSIGTPIVNTQAYVLDDDARLVPVGVPGELYVGGVGVARGYVGQPGLTADRFVPDPFSARPGARLYRTGDRARLLPGGGLEFLGRRDTQIKMRGLRIELGEIESVLRQHPDVRDAVVVAVDDAVSGTHLVAYVVGGDGPVDRDQVQGFLRQRLPGYMVPAVYVALDALPLTVHGKVDRAALPRARRESTRRHEPPRTPIEEILTGIWGAALGRAEVGVLDDFFELGGQSLLATRVVSRIREALHVEVPLRSIFETPTVRAIAEQIERAQQRTAPAPIERTRRDGALPLSFAQQRLWVLDRLQPDAAIYNVAFAVRLEGDFDPGAFAESLTAVVARHEALRTRFVADGGTPVQVIDPPFAVPLPVHDLRAWSEAAKHAEIEGRQRAEASMPFDLASGRLLRTQVIWVRDREYLLLLTLHHIVFDGWSAGVLIRELSAHYTSAVRGEPPVLPPLPIQSADFAVWQRTWLQGPLVDDQLAYWRATLADAPITELPTDFPRPTAATGRTGSVGLQLEGDLRRRLQALCAEEGVTLFMVLLAALAVLLSRYTAYDDIVVGAPVAGRTRRDTEDLIGFFVNTLVLRTRVGADVTVRQLLRQVREVALGAYANQDVPFERVVDELQPHRRVDHSPLFRILFAVQNAPLPPLDLLGVTSTPFEIETPAKFDLGLNVYETAEAICTTLHYDADLFVPATARRLLENYRVLLTSMVEHPDGMALDLPLLAETEIEQLSAWSRS